LAEVVVGARPAIARTQRNKSEAIGSTLDSQAVPELAAVFNALGSAQTDATVAADYRT
jgi:hypothetical protein